MPSDSATNPANSWAATTPPPESGRVFTTHRRVSVDDANAAGRMEFDGIARFLQDAGNDDTDDAGLHAEGMAWVARRLTIEVSVAPRSREQMKISTWCSGTGSRWAERRTSMVGESAGHVEAAAIWVHLDPETGRPTRWGDGFAQMYLEAAGDRQVEARLRHDKVVPNRDGDGVSELEFRFRASDTDAFGHVNNAAYLSILEEVLSAEISESTRVEVEWRAPSQAGEQLTAVIRSDEDGLQVWLVDAADQLRVTMTVTG